MPTNEHHFSPDLTGVRLARHLGEMHSYHSSSDLEDFDATHRWLHGVPSRSEERLREIQAKAWDEGYGAGERDAHAASEARQWNGRNLDDDELTRNPYVPEPVSTEPVQTNPDLWRN